MGGGGPSNSSRNIGDIFYTTRTDNSLNGAVECNGSQYNFSDFDSNLQSLLDNGSIPSVTINEFDSIVSEKGWCDKIGYKTPKMVKIYPSANQSEQPFIYIELTDEQYNSFYDTMNNCKRNEILPYRLYDINTAELLNGYYLKCLDDVLGYFVVFNNEDEETSFAFHEVMGYYVTTDGSLTIPDPDKSQTDPTTYFKVSAYIIQKENIPVIGNGIALGFTDNHTDYSITKSTSSSSSGIVGIGNLYGKNVGDSIPSGSGIQSRYATGITTDPTKSGIISDLSNDSFTGRVMIQLFNSTTDTAVATCNQVLADVSALNQGDYVIYYDSADITDHSHAYSNANTLTNHQWYRIYKSGWIEQGGEVPYDGTASTSKKVMEISLPVVMSNTNYYVNAIFNGFNKLESYNCSLDDCTTNSITIMNNTYTSNNFYCFGCRWEVKGFANITN